MDPIGIVILALMGVFIVGVVASAVVKAGVRRAFARIEAEIETEMQALGPEAQEGARRIVGIIRSRLGL